MTCSTIPNILNCLETAERVSNLEKAQNQWQRQLNVGTGTCTIKNFTSNNQNVIANTRSFSLRRRNSTQFDELMKMYIDMHWLEKLKRENTAMSAKQRGRCNRPIWLIDGQHRIILLRVALAEPTWQYRSSFSQLISK